jgi:pimeloyl-ACP methyl ester carboxylesterase
MPTLQPFPDLPITVVDTGAGERTTLILHGGSGPDGVSTIVDHFAPHSRVLAPTHPGWNDTPRPEWFTGVDSLAVTYLDLLDDEDLTDVLVIGSSFGGWVAAEMAVRDRGHRIGRLVLIDAIGPEIPEYQIQIPTAAEGRGPTQANIETMLAYTGVGMNDPKLLRRLARVQVPTLAVWGADDMVVPPGFGKIYAETFADAQFEVIPGVGHMPTLQDPDATFRAIDSFLAV